MSLTAKILVVAIVTAAIWWMSGYDTRLTGENPRSDFLRRLIRSAITLVLLWLTALGGLMAVPIFVVIAVIWAGCLAEFGARQFHKLVDGGDHVRFDPKDTQRRLGQLTQFIRNGQNTQALDLCHELETSGEVSPLILDATIYPFYRSMLDSFETSAVLAEARRWYRAGKFVEAETELRRILAAQPKNDTAILFLMQIWARDLSQPQKALALLEPVGSPPRLHRALVRYARRSLEEWSHEGRHLQAVEQEKLAPPMPSRTEPELCIDDLLKRNQLATAVERLESDLRAYPQDVHLWLKLAETYAVYCADWERARRIIQKMESTATFAPAEIQFAKSRLKEWRNIRRS